MRATDQLDAVELIELFSDLRAKLPARSSLADGPGLDICWVRPHQVGERPLVRDLLLPLEQADLIDRGEVRGKPSVYTENTAIYYTSQDKVVKYLCTVLPGIGAAILADTLVVEPIHLRDLPRLMVPAQDGDPEANRPKPLASFVRTRGGEA